MCACRISGDGETQADAGDVLIAGGVEAAEGAEGVFVVFLRDTGAVVLDNDCGFGGGGRDGEPDAFAVVGGVVGEVGNGALQGERAQAHRDRRCDHFQLRPRGGGGDGGGGGTDPGTDPVNDGLGVINIPVYFHVVYSDATENVSDAQITAQMKVLNDDFRKANNDINQVPSEFSGVAADSEITFTYAGTFRHQNSKTSWGTNNTVKTTYPPITPETHLNIWVCDIGGGILGYAQFPGGSSSTDGVVLLYSSLPGGSAAPYNEGRTATHEVGHYLNLRHIWGDTTCGSDLVADTPSHNTANYGVPTYPHYSTCTGTPVEMTMNYMDYTDDRGMYMFSIGQKARIDAIFLSGGPRFSFAQP